MKTKKYFVLLIAVIMLVTIIPVSVFAVEGNGSQSQPAQIKCTPKINGEEYYGDCKYIKRGYEVTLSVENITLNGQTPDPSKICYQWSKRVDVASNQNPYQDISGATQSTYTFAYDGLNEYVCRITVMDLNDVPRGYSGSFYLKEDTLTVSISSNPLGKYDDEGDYRISNVPLGEQVTLTVDASSTKQDANLTYEWDYMVVGTHQYPTILSETSNTLSFSKGIGIELFGCYVSDGNRSRYVMFFVDPVDTLTVTPTINGFMPKRFERGYMYVAKPGEEVMMKVDAVSKNENIEYSWQKYRWDVESENYVFEDLGTTNSETIIKEEEIYDFAGIDPYGIEMYECYIKDGTELVNVSFIVFNIMPEQVTTEVDAGNDVPSISINNSPEELSNDLLKDNLEDLSYGATAEVKLTAEKRDNLLENEQKIIEGKMSEDSEVGMYLDINLYKKVNSDENNTQITETQKDINLSIDIPQNLINENEGVTRSYQIIRVHDGAAETLDAQYDAETKSLTFNTDRFSTYALVYKDKAAVSGDINNDGSVNTVDLTVMREYLVGMENSGIVLVRADLSGEDGVVDVCDLIRLKKIVSSGMSATSYDS